MIRTLYVSDLDGTLLRSDGTLSDESARLINAAVEAGGLFTYATARSFSSSRRVTAQLRLALPVATYGGAIMAHPETGAAIDVRLLANGVVHALVDAAEVDDTTAPVLHTFEDGTDWLRWNPHRRTSGIERFLSDRVGDRRLRPITRDDPVDTGSVFYISVLAARPALVSLRHRACAALNGVAQFLSADAHTPGHDWFELLSAEGTKAKAIRRLAASVDADRVVVFGDNHNDVPMFDVADEGYAVANAVPELRAIATKVLDHHDCDPVSRWIADDFARRSPPS
ncbi:MAG: HAD hydrolase family protein [Microbacterium sp.]